jgi:hypothetical protein
MGQASASSAKRHPRSWHAKATLHAEEQTDNNVFQLSDSAKIRLDTLTAAAPPGSRFADMQSVNDYITVVEGSVGVEGTGLFGRPLSIRSDDSYNWYARNPVRGNGEFGLSLAQGTPMHGRLQVRGRLLPSYFYRNFMSDAVDLNGDGVIQSAERIYSAGTYRDSRLLGGYRQPLIRPSTSRHFGLAVEVEAGRFVRTYAAPLDYRSYRGPVVDATLALELTQSVKLDLGYTRASLNSQPDSAVLRLDEPDFNQDLNGNGTVTDLRVRSVQLVDFSRREQDVDVKLRLGGAGPVTARVGYEHRWRRFSSTQPFDVLNLSRRDRRNFVGAELTCRLGAGAHLSFGGDFELQKHSQPLITSTTDEVNDYTRRRVYAGLGYRL